MTQLEHIQAEIESLSSEEFTYLREWFAALDWQRWDKQLEADVAKEKLESLRREAVAAKANGTLQVL